MTDTPRGHLKIYLGMCPGVGKTCAMLQAAHTLLRQGTEVLVGVVETHGRAETAALANGLPTAPVSDISHGGTVLHEMDIDSILARRPAVVLVDELAHTNTPGSRHPKRHQDVAELLDAGINVHTTVNIQHIESRVDIVRQITGVTIRETVPDALIDRADEVELVDLTPDQLRRRLAEGRIYPGERATAAAANFFKPETLIALREMALRYTAEKVDQELRQFMRSRRIRAPWRARDRLLVAVGSSPYAESLLRWTRRQAGMLDCPWTALHVDTGLPLPDAARARLAACLTLARQLGAEVASTTGDDVGESVLRFARENGVTQIVLGKSEKSAWSQFFHLTFAEKLIRASGDIDVLVVRPEKSTHPAATFRENSSFHAGDPVEWLLALAISAGVTGLSLPLLPYTGHATIALLYLLAVVLASFRLGRWPALALATASVLLWDYLFIPPRFTLHIGNAHDALMCAVFFIVAGVTGHLASRLRERERVGRERERRTATLLAFSQTLVNNPDTSEAVKKALAMIAGLLRSGVALMIRLNSENLAPRPAPGSTFVPDDKERAVAAWCYIQNKTAGKFTETLGHASCLHLPLATQALHCGVLLVQPTAGQQFDPRERALLDHFAAQLATALEKEHVLAAIRHAELADRSAQLQKTLLDSVSHELKTPLAALQTATDLLERELFPAASPPLQEIRTATARLARTVNHLLDTARLESGAIRPLPEWFDPAELLSDLARTFRERHPAHPLAVRSPADRLILTDPALLEKALWNLLDNAALHTPDGSSVELSGHWDGPDLLLQVRDHGPGIPSAELPRLFEKFHRGTSRIPGGTGLGLSIAKGLLGALGGDLSASVPSDGVGSLFTARLRPESRPSVSLSS